MDNTGLDIEPEDFNVNPSTPAAADAVTVTPPSKRQTKEIPIILYRRRWVILAIYSLISMMNQVIWISLSSVASVVQNYYRVSSTSINWLGMIFSLMNVTLIATVCILNRYGLKVTIVGGAVCNTAASVIRLVGCRRSGYIYALIGSALGGLGQSFLLFVIPTLSSVWFGEKERARASSIGLLMNMLGVAVGFLMGSLFIPNSSDYVGVVEEGMFTTLLIQAIVCAILLMLSVIFIQQAPASPPSYTQVLDLKRSITKRETRRQSDADKLSEVVTARSENNVQINDIESTGFFKNWKMLLSNKNFHLLAQAYGLYFGLFVTASNLLNQMVSQYFPDSEEGIGLVGFAAVICGVIGIMTSGVLIDKTHRYKSISVAIYSSCTLSSLLFVLVLKYGKNFPCTFACFCLYGFCSYPYLSVGLEYTAEVLYPVKTSILSFILLFMSALYSFILTYIIGLIVDRSGADVAGYVMTGCYAIGFISIAFVRGDLKRYNIDSRKKAEGA